MWAGGDTRRTFCTFPERDKAADKIYALLIDKAMYKP